jgi:hypothetical protein
MSNSSHVSRREENGPLVHQEQAAGSNPQEEELRVDPSDGQAYRQSDFVSFYGTTVQWEGAQPFDAQHNI